MAIRHAIRSLVRSPWYAVTAIGTITLTIALSATVFAVIDGVLFRSLPYPDADRVFRVTGVDATGGSASLAPADVRYLADAHPGILVAPYRARGSVVRPAQPDLALATTLVGPRFFDLLGQTPVIGGFAPEHFDARPPEAPTPALVTHALWRQWLGEDPSPVGRVIDVVGGRLEIVGVLPDDFVFPVSRGTSVPDLLLPLVATSDSLNRWARSVTTLARLDAAIGLAEAQQRLNAALEVRANDYPRLERPPRPGPYVAVDMRPLNDALGASERPMFRVAFGGAGLLVLLGAINVAGLFGARARERGRELTTRSALGARWRDLTRVLMAEVAVIGVCGGLLGLVAAHPCLQVAHLLLPDNLRLLKAPIIDWRVAAFAMFVAVGPLLLCALVPAGAAISRAASGGGSTGGTTTTPRRSRGRVVLLGAQAAVGVVLVLTGGLLLTSFAVLRAVDTGFDHDGLAVVELLMTDSPGPEEQAARQDAAMARMERVPGVRGVARLGESVLDGGLEGLGSMCRPAASSAG